MTPEVKSYVIALLSLVALTYITVSFVDFQFKVIVGGAFDEITLVRFLGQFYGVVGVLSFLLQVLALRHLVERFGSFASIGAMPAMFAAFGGLLPIFPGLWVTCLLEFAESGLRYATFSPMLQTLFLPLKKGVRTRIQSFSNGVVKPLFIGVAGVLLMILRPDQEGGITTQYLGIAIAVLGAGMLMLLIRVRRGYLQALVEVTSHIVDRRRRQPVEITSVSIGRHVQDLVEGGGEAAVSWALRRVDVPNPEYWKEIVEAALAKPDLGLVYRTRLLCRWFEYVNVDSLDLGEDASQRVLGLFATVKSDRRHWRTVAHHLYDDDAEIREATIRFLCDTMIPEAVIEAREAVLTATEGSAEDVLIALRLLDVLDEQERLPLLATALAVASDETSNHLADETRAAALEYLTHYPTHQCLHLVVLLLEHRRHRTAAIHALAAAGLAGFEAIKDSRSDTVWRVLGLQWDLYTQLATGIDWFALVSEILNSESDPVFFKPALLAAARSRDRDAARGLLPRFEFICTCAAIWGLNLEGLQSSDDSSAHRLLRRAACERYRAATESAIALLLMNHPPPIDHWENLLHGDVLEDSTRTSNLTEIIEQTVPRAERERVVALLENKFDGSGRQSSAFAELLSPIPVLAAYHFASTGQPTCTQEEMMKAVIDRILFLNSVDLFKGLRGEELEHIAEILEDCHYQPNEQIVTKDDPGDSLFLLREGRIRVHDGEQTLAELGTGDVVGEMALLDNLSRSADATALSEVSAWRLERADFDLLIAVYPAIARSPRRLKKPMRRESFTATSNLRTSRVPGREGSRFST